MSSTPRCLVLKSSIHRSQAQAVMQTNGATSRGEHYRLVFFKNLAVKKNAKGARYAIYICFSLFCFNTVFKPDINVA